MLIQVLLALRTQDAVDLLQFKLSLLMGVLDLVDVTADERLIHLVLVGQMRQTV